MSLPRFQTVFSTIAPALLAALSATAVQAQTKTIYIGMNGGDMERSYTKYVFPAFERIHNAKVVVVPGTSSDILAKVQASKEKPPVHVMFLDDGVMMRAIKMGLCQKITDTAALKDLYPAAQMAGGMAAGVNVGMTGIGYNKMVAECVTAHNDAPELAQKLAAFLLTPQAQAAALEFGNQIPSNLKTQPSTPAAQATVDRFKGYMKNVVTLDWDSINALRPEWNARWNKQIER